MENTKGALQFRTLAGRVLYVFMSAIAALSQTPADRSIQAVFKMDNEPTGTYRESRSVSAEGKVNTRIESDLIFNRMGTKLEIKSDTQYHEDAEGNLKALESTISSSAQATLVALAVNGNSLAIKTSTGGKTYERNQIFSGALLGPEGGRQLALSRLHKETDSISYQTFAPELGSVVTITDTLVAREPVVVDGQSVAASKIEQTMSVMPGKSLIWLDQQGWMLRQITPSPLGDIEAARSGKNEMTVPVEGATLPEETFRHSIVTANVRLPQERLIERIRLKITQKRPDFGWPDFSAENQKVIEKTRDYLVLEIWRPEPKSHGIRPFAMTDNLRPFLAPNALLQSDDQTVIDIAKQVVKKNLSGENKDAWATAQALQRWTNDNMHFDLGIAVAPASEVAKNRRGTCFGYSMLLGSLARAAGIPSRIRMGFVYAGGIWGGHAWVEVLIGDEWIPVDGALYAPGAADAARFSVFDSALEDGTLAGIASLGQLFGNVDISILEYTVAGRTVHVPPDAKPYTIEGNTYRNRWIGITVKKPDSYSFSGADLKWPQTILIAMDGPQKQRIEIHNLSVSLPTSSSDAAKIFGEEEIAGDIPKVRIGRYETSMISNPDKTALLLQKKGSVWMLTAAGPKAKEDLLRVARTIRLDK
jgi:transglutaminase-like putative cysteine protease